MELNDAFCSEAVKADVCRLMEPSQRQGVVEIAQQYGIHVITLDKWRKAWRLQGVHDPAQTRRSTSG